MANLHPPAGGCLVTEEDIEKIAEARYRRFHWEYGRPLWRDGSMERIRAKFRREVKEVIDAMQMSGFGDQEHLFVRTKTNEKF